jgi:hypothetical protein
MFLKLVFKVSGPLPELRNSDPKKFQRRDEVSLAADVFGFPKRKPTGIPVTYPDPSSRAALVYHKKSTTKRTTKAHHEMHHKVHHMIHHVALFGLDSANTNSLPSFWA